MNSTPISLIVILGLALVGWGLGEAARWLEPKMRPAD
jgi:hypothetical protein